MIKRTVLFKLIWRPASVHIVHEHHPSVPSQKSIREMNVGGVVNQVRELLFNFQSPLARYGTRMISQKSKDTKIQNGREGGECVATQMNLAVIPKSADRPKKERV